VNGLLADAAHELAALSTLLQTEYGVIYGLAAAGGQLTSRVPGIATDPASIVAATTAAFDQHRLRRDRLIATLQTRQATVPVALPAYQVTRSDQQAVLLDYLAELAQSTIVAYRAALGDLADPTLRTDAVTAIVEAARFRTTALHTAGRSDDLAAPALPG
jgi:hypothetical protein